ncbi:MAG: AI-2E family transporter [Actinomycetota bacterium]|nr:AI-2E family transporter [Actinomycetota bacterium]MDK1102233.1 AI-2E family transporter [Actinomycetota bacterium]
MAESDFGSVVRRVGIFSWSLIGIFLLAIGAFYLLVEGRVILAPLLLAIVIVFILNPLVNWLGRHRIPRVIGAIIGFFFFFSALSLLVIVLFPDIRSQAESFVETFPLLYDQTADDLRRFLASVGVANVAIIDYEQLLAYINDPQNRSTLLAFVFDSLGTVTAGIFEFILIFLLGPVLAFYFLIDLPSVQKRLFGLVPSDHQDEAAHVGRQLHAAIGGFLKGQLLVAVIVGVMLSFGYWAIGLEFWLLIGLVGGLLNIVPFLGPWVGGILGVLVAVATADVSTAIWAVVVAVIVQQVDNNFVSPAVLRATVRLHPAVTLLVLVMGGVLAGIWGVLIAVPLVASMKILLGHWWRTRVLGQTWEEASEAMFEEPEPSRLIRTGEIPIVESEDSDLSESEDETD